eukprot:5373626-Pleurochrysis_carterae.AAC.4
MARATKGVRCCRCLLTPRAEAPPSARTALAAPLKGIKMHSLLFSLSETISKRVSEEPLQSPRLM